MLRPRRSVRNGVIEKKASISSTTSNTIPSPLSPRQTSNLEEPEQPLRLLEPRECVGRSIQIGLNEEIELLFKNPPSSDRSSPIPFEVKTSKADVISNSTISTDDPPKFQRTETFIRYIEPTQCELDDMIEYEMDEMDLTWLKQVNQERSKRNFRSVKEEEFELLIDRLEKESHFQALVNGDDLGQSIDEDALCVICLDGECSNCNAILFCDMCNMAVHQECYGVPYVPEGQWLCRRCFLSPSKSVQCVLCPNRFGAFKQVDDGERWAHVVCAIWIPEVHFANTVFLEPICNINQIPVARWRFTCYICKQKNVGACIQCAIRSCCTSFHVTCAQQAGLYMEIDENDENESVTNDDVSNSVSTNKYKKQPPKGATRSPPPIRRRAYCHQHTPIEVVRSKTKGRAKRDENEEEALERIQKERMKTARKILAERRKCDRSVSVPVVPKEKMEAVLNKVTFSDRDNFFKRIQAYWTLKRMSRSGVPLLKRLQNQRSTKKKSSNSQEYTDKQLSQQMIQWRRLRQDLERTRLLVELIRKREKLKRDLVKIDQQVLDYQIRPLNVFLHHLLEQLESLDEHHYFANPVDETEVPTYYKFITHPMDFLTMKKKVDQDEYTSLDHFENDFGLIVKNCHFFNEAKSPFYKAATKLRDKGLNLLKQARRVYETTGYDLKTGQLKEESTADDLDYAFEDRLEVLLQRLKEYQTIEPRSKHVVNLKKQIAQVRRTITKNLSNSSLNNINDDSVLQRATNDESMETVSSLSPNVSSLNVTRNQAELADLQFISQIDKPKPTEPRNESDQSSSE
ncbi:unnamed protein product [Rotaria socialis]|uniref:Bromodomain and PHD finger-containing protein n=1 Tax=Rotaria socialis TaxID=392032 RepID=A0A820JQN3_9BILA|nr:unnamed protein product [Rotaria socialis]CAF3423599.1 unnamed protein product [Rotaria socialis]CAF3667753.1 unnamed protein product [Rotaria socialis]CAF4096078.1 unnamed protein product [Rotaria socialis]CAF4310848.1 unnamed protein product [Rotaria socialis]